MNNNDKIIISLCGGTGSWERFYREAGYDVRLITLPDYDVRQTQFGTDGHIYFYSPDGKGTMDGIDPKKVYGILAAPPCTKFSKADTGHPRAVRDFTEGIETVEACLKVIWQAQMKGAPLAFWALENPQGYLSRFLGRSIFRFQHWEFGETRKALAILGMFLVTLLLVSSFLNIINHIFSVLGMVVIVFTFLMIARYMRRYDERNKLAQIELANHKGLRE